MTRTAVVTGGGTGIGRAVAARLVADGHAVTITGRRAGVLAAAAEDIGARAVTFDATDPDAVTAALSELPEQVDVLVNNAGGLSSTGTAAGHLHAVRQSLLYALELNVVSTALVTEALWDRFGPAARIVNIGSIAGSRGSGGYGAAKAAVVALTLDVARRIGPRGGTANVIAPGLIEDTEFFGGGLTEQRRQTLIEQTFTGRAGEPDDIAAAVAYLTAPAAGQVTGQVLHVNGGAWLGG